MDNNFDVLCVGHASYDLVFSVAKHPADDEKIVADSLISCGGGPAANAAIIVARLGFKAAFAGFLGNDLYGDKHLQELLEDKVETQLIARGISPTPLSTVLVKTDGKRALINYKGDTQPLTAESIDFSNIKAKVILFDGHEPDLSINLLEQAHTQNSITVLDAGSVHKGTLALLDKVDYLVCSEKFARQYAGNEKKALRSLAKFPATVVITLGEKGLIWQRGKDQGSLPAYPIKAVDTTGAGDAFHGAFSAALTADMEWLEILQYACSAGSYCCTHMGARPGLPTAKQHHKMLRQYQDFLNQQGT